MKKGYLLSAILLLTACGGRTMNANLAKNLMVEMPEEILKNNDVEVVRVSQIGGTEAVAETRLKAGVRFERVGNEWQIREVRLGHGQWEELSNLLQALEAVKTEETRTMLGRIAEAVAKYQQANNTLPVFSDYVSLSDILSPMYLTPLIRLDAWRRPLRAERVDANTIRVWSDGPDGKNGTADDISRTISSDF